MDLKIISVIVIIGILSAAECGKPVSRYQLFSRSSVPRSTETTKDESVGRISSDVLMNILQSKGIVTTRRPSHRDYPWWWYYPHPHPHPRPPPTPNPPTPVVPEPPSVPSIPLTPAIPTPPIFPPIWPFPPNPWNPNPWNPSPWNPSPWNPSPWNPSPWNPSPWNPWNPNPWSINPWSPWIMTPFGPRPNPWYIGPRPWRRDALEEGDRSFEAPEDEPSNDWEDSDDTDYEILIVKKPAKSIGKQEDPQETHDEAKADKTQPNSTDEE